jgi:hypothetical protein
MESEQFNNSSLVKAKELWISELYKWADDNNCSGIVNLAT